MRRLLLLLLVLGLIACGDKDTPAPDIKVTDEIISIDKPLHAVDDSIMVAIRYSIFPADAEPEVTITCNNKSPYATEPDANEEKRIVTAWLPPAANPGENEIVINIRSGSKEYVFTKPFRVIQDNNLPTWWPALDYETLERAFPLYFEIGTGRSSTPLVNGEYHVTYIGIAAKQAVLHGELYKKANAD